MIVKRKMIVKRSYYCLGCSLNLVEPASKCERMLEEHVH